jgi:hypothetical protein
MVRFVNDNGLKIRHQTRQARATAERLHTGHHDRGVVRILLPLHHADLFLWGHQPELVHGLLDEFVAVRQNQGAADALLHQQGNNNGFAGAGGQHQHGTAHPPQGGRDHGLDRLVLVGARRQPGGRGGTRQRHGTSSAGNGC